MITLNDDMLKSTAFPANVTRLFLPPVFEERAWKQDYCITAIKASGT